MICLASRRLPPTQGTSGFAELLKIVSVTLSLFLRRLGAVKRLSGLQFVDVATTWALDCQAPKIGFGEFFVTGTTSDCLHNGCLLLGWPRRDHGAVPRPKAGWFCWRWPVSVLLHADWSHRLYLSIASPQEIKCHFFRHGKLVARCNEFSE